jgi:hypothetical protein
MIFSAMTYYRFIERVLAAVLLLAAIAKLVHFKQTAALFGPGPVPGNIALLFVIELEFAMSVWMLIGIAASARFYCALACFSFLGSAACLEIVRGAPNCGCFGEFHISPIVTGSFDVVAVVSLWCLHRRIYGAEGNCAAVYRRRCAIAGILLASGSLPLVFLSASPADNPGKSAISNPSLWTNREFPLFDEIAGSSDIRFGRWLIVFYHFDCDECRRVVPTYVTFASSEQDSPGQPQIAFVALPPFAPSGADPIPISSNLRCFKLSEEYNWQIPTPLVVTAQDGRVVDVAEGQEAFK